MSEGRGGIIHAGQASTLADILERVLDKGVVIAGDVTVSLVGVELLTLKVRLLIASADKARELGIDWWERDPALSSKATPDDRELRAEIADLRRELDALRAATPAGPSSPRRR